MYLLPSERASGVPDDSPRSNETSLLRPPQPPRMVDILSGIVDFVASNPLPILLVVALLLVVFRLYLFFRRTVKEFRRGMDDA